MFNSAIVLEELSQQVSFQNCGETNFWGCNFITVIFHRIFKGFKLILFYITTI